MLQFGFKRNASKEICYLWDNASFENGLDGWEAINGGTLTLEADGTVTVTGGIRRVEPVDIGKILLLVYADIRTGQPTLRFRNIEDNTIDIMQQYEQGITTYTAIPNEGVWGIELVGNFNIVTFASRSLSGCELSNAHEVSLPHSGWTYIDGDAENVELVVDGISIFRNIPTVVEGTLEYVDGSFKTYKAGNYRYPQFIGELIENINFDSPDIYWKTVNNGTFTQEYKKMTIESSIRNGGIKYINPYYEHNTILMMIDVISLTGGWRYQIHTTSGKWYAYDFDTIGIHTIKFNITGRIDIISVSSLETVLNTIETKMISVQGGNNGNNICMNGYELDNFIVRDSEYLDTGSAQFYGWKAFNCTTNDVNDCWAIETDGTAIKPAWVEIEYPYEVQVYKINITPRTGMDTAWYTDNNPYDFAIEIDGIEVHRETKEWNDGITHHIELGQYAYVGRRFRLIIYETQLSSNGGIFHTAIGNIGIDAIDVTGKDYAKHKIPYYNPQYPEPRD